MSIPVDKATYDKYQVFSDAHLRAVAQQYVTLNTANPTETLYARIDLNEAKDCPFLAEDRLCGVQKEYGPEALSATCSIYPRVLNRVQDELEMSLYLSCPEAARNVLLNPDLLQTMEAAEAPYFRTDQFSRQASDGPGALHKPYAYSAEVRRCIVTLLQDVQRPLWQRVFLLGMLCQRLDTMTTPEHDAAVPQVLEDYRNIVATGALRRDLDNLPAQPAVQLDVILRISDMRLRAGAGGERFYECFQAFVRGVGYAPHLTPVDYAQHYVDAERQFFRPFFDKYPYILENYLLNYIFRTLFPFGRAASAHFTPQNIFTEYMLLATQYAVVRGLLIGMAGQYRETLDTTHVIRLIQSFSKAVEHNPTFLRQISEFLHSRNLDNPQGMAILLKSATVPVE